jgi:rubrerythrin
MPEISYQTFREMQTQNEMDRIAAVMSRPVVTVRAVMLQKELARIAAEASRDVENQHHRELAQSKQVHEKSKCPNCGRMIKKVFGHFMSHRVFERSNGDGRGKWCVNNGLL